MPKVNSGTERPHAPLLESCISSVFMAIRKIYRLTVYFKDLALRALNT